MDPIEPALMTVLLKPTPHLSSVADLPTMLDSIAHALSQLTPGAHVAITAASSTGTLETLAGTHRVAFVLNEIQHGLGEGPCLTAVREDHTVIIDDARSEQRWPQFMARAIDLGLRSYLGVPISIDDRAIGGLSLYSTTPYRLDAVRLSHAKLFAAQAAMAMRHAQRENDLRQALPTSRAIGTAIGLVMERSGLDDEEAFAYLARLSRSPNAKLRHVAAQLVTQVNDLRRSGVRGAGS